MGRSAYIYFRFTDNSDGNAREIITAELPENFKLVELENPLFEKHGFQFEIENPCRYYDRVSEGTGWWLELRETLKLLVNSCYIDKVWYGDEIAEDEITESIERGYTTEDKPNIDLFTLADFNAVEINYYRQLKA